MQINTKYGRLLFLVILLSRLVFLSTFVSAQTYGLKFNAHEVTLDKRTELDLTPDDFLYLQDEFEISFDYKTTRIAPNSNAGFFGYVFRVITKDDRNVDLLSTPTPEVGLNLVIGESNTIIPAKYSSEYVNNWITLRVKFLLSEDRLIFYTPDTFYVHENIGFKEQEQVKIIFGANDYKQFKNSDVPSMTVKDIKISEKGKLSHYWMLNEKEGGIAKDKIKGLEAKVVNPSWMVVNHHNWQKILEHEIKGEISFALDRENGDIFMVGKNELSIYSTQKNNINKIKYKNTPLFFDRNYRAIFNNVDKKIYCYIVDEVPFYTLDITSGIWNEVGKRIPFETRYRHHNSYFNASDNSIYLFGGYGWHRYNNELVKIDVETGTRKELLVDENVFTPRYLSGLGELNDTIYILGGYGSQSGNQLINPQSNFDLIGYSIKNDSWFKKFEIPHLIDDMILGQSLWIDAKTRNYYTLIFSKIKFENEMQLIKGNLDSPEVELVGDNIPFKFLDIRTQMNLSYIPTRNKLYTYTAYTNDSTSLVSIYSIDNPPNKSESNVVQETRSGNLIFYIAIIFSLLFLIIIWIVLRRRKAKSVIDNLKNAQDSEQSIDTTVGFIIESVPELPKYNLIFFGGFQVFNKEFTDTTNKFSPLLKELFLLILLHTYKNNKGISSDKIIEVLWYDKSEKSARNNRAVNIAKLRGILEEVGSCELSKKTGYWKIELKDSKIKSDYVDFLNISASKNNLTKQNVNLLINITQKGSFLSNVHYDWLDDFKSNVSDNIIDTLVEFGQSCDVKKEADFIIHLADSIFNFDVINEDAMMLKCKAQYCMGKHSHAKATYEKFFKEYVSMYGQEYEKAFLDILEIKE